MKLGFVPLDLTVGASGDTIKGRGLFILRWVICVRIAGLSVAYTANTQRRPGAFELRQTKEAAH